MKKVQLVTFHTAINHGTVLQAYALQKITEGLGFEVEIIDYRPPFMAKDFWAHHGFITLAKKILQFGIFYLFMKKNFHLSKNVYQTPDDLGKHPISADYWICGSDQLWNMAITHGLDPIYLLDHPSIRGKKIAYAVSMGHTAVPDRHREKFREALSAMNTISVREPFTRDQLRQCGRHDSLPIVLDPTLLPVEFANIIPKTGPIKPYIALYYVVGDEGVGQAALQLKKILGIPIINISSSRFKGADKNELWLSPGGWLKRIRDASIVCTNSFHGTALSVKYEKSFYTVRVHSRDPWSENRISDLLSSLGLKHRLVDSHRELPEHKSELLDTTDFKEAMTLIKERQSYSLLFLKKSLGV